ncbi:MAG: NAD-dependent epimerase/dehydratase family protein [Bacteroidia bacterium]|nr:NAD-dependent epimerase/dehydratase family protein [Bacteroidia bacterium]
MIFVTGGTGFLGAHLLAKLAGEGVPIRALKRRNSSTVYLKKILAKKGYPDFYDKIEWIEGDMLDYELLLENLKDVSHVIHAAAIVSFNKKDFKLVTNGNINGTSNLVDAALSNNVKRFCHISSIAALGGNENGNLIDENTEWRNDKENSAYSIAKYYSELQAWRGHSEGMELVVVNPSVIIGSGNWKTDISALFTKVNNGLKYYTSGSTGFVDVNDVADIVIKLALHSNINGERFVINAENLSYREILNLIAKSLNKELPRKEVGEKTLNLVYKLSTIASFFNNKKSLISRDMARIASSKLSYSNKKICDLLSYNFKTINETIREMTIDFLAENKK